MSIFQTKTLVDLIAPFLVLVVLLKIVFSVINLYKRKRQSEKSLAAFPATGKNPLIGNIHKFPGTEAGYQYAEKVFKDCEHGFQLWVGPFMCCIVCISPSTVQPILATTEPKDEFTYGLIKPWLGDGLLISKGNKWFRNRRLLTPGFHFDILKPYVQIFNECANAMLNKWSNIYQEGSLEMFEHVSLLTLDGLLKCIFSQESHCQTGERHPYIQAVSELTKLVEKRFHFPPYQMDLIFHLSPHGYKWRKYTNIVHKYSEDVIKQRKESIKAEREQNIQHKRKYIDFLDILLAAEDEDGKGLTDQEIRDEVDTFMFEGHDTTASGISWCMHHIANNPEHQEKCRQEIDEILDSKSEDVIEWDDLNKLTYLTMCIKESMRLSPPVIFVGRRLTKPLKIPDLDVTFDEGQWVGISFIGLHNNAFLWENPERFDPLRFTPENSQSRSPYAYLPFSAGPRNCIGQNFALNEMKVIMALTLRKFELAVDESVPARKLSSVVLKSEDGLRVFVKPRN
ncbi:leukotriene-B4 omega-hydroxylase 3-like [Glandiceps talaboti]